MTLLRPHSKLKRQEIRAAYLFILPALIGILLFAIIPGLFGLGLSFYDYSFVGTGSKFVGLDNFRQIQSDPLFFKAFGNSLLFALMSVVLTIVGGLGLALLVKQRVMGIAFFRTAYFIPVVVSMVVVSTVWRLIFHTNSGLLNSVLLSIGLPAQPFLTSPKLALPSIAVMSFWKQAGFIMLIYLGALLSISEDLYEAAKIDGANTWKSFRYITLPMLQRVTLFVLVVTTIDSIKVFTQVYVMTNGGPLDSTTVIVFHIFRTAFRYYDIGYASAMSSILFIIVLLITWAQFRLLRTDMV